MNCKGNFYNDKGINSSGGQALEFYTDYWKNKEERKPPNSSYNHHPDPQAREAKLQISVLLDSGAKFLTKF